jgi:hypothetical protein
MLRSELKARLMESGDYEDPDQLPAYLQGYDYRWAPTFVLRHKQSGSIVGFELVYTAVLPLGVLEQAKRAQEEHDGFAVVLLTSLTNAGDDLGEYCRAQGFGLFVYTSETISPIVAAKFAKAVPIAASDLPDEGWIPSAVSEQVKGFNHIGAGEVIRAYVPRLGGSGVTLPQAMATVQSALDHVLTEQRKGFAAPFPFYGLAGLQGLLLATGSPRPDHVVHSFRVYVTGCVILDHFWDVFDAAWQSHIWHGNARIDDVWFLISMFHDCGYFRHPELRREAATVLDLPHGDADLTATATAALGRDEYRRASQAIGSLLAHLRRPQGNWDFGSVGGTIEDEMQALLLRWYATLEFHGVVSALDLAAQMVRDVHSASERGKDSGIDRAFLAGHVFPAAAAIALHEWRLWPDLKRYRLFPFRASYYPLAGLLMFLDTWDDYRRRGDNEMAVSGLELADRSATVRVRWRDPERLSRARAGYEDYSRSVRWSRQMSMNIVVDEGEP